MRYAMILKNRVIDIQHSETEPHYPPDPLGNPVTAVQCGETVKIGMMYDAETGTFSEYVPPETEPIPEPEPTQLDEIQRTQIDIMEAMACQYEENLENQLMQMDVLATIYETQLGLGGVE